MYRKRFKRTCHTLCLTLALSLVLEGLSFASPVATVPPSIATQKLSIAPFVSNPEKLNLPLEYVTLREVHKGDSGKLIIHIQDAHANLSGQKNLAGALDAMMTQYDLDLVMVEGAARQLSLDKVRELAPLKEWKIIARRFLFDGVISGEEYLNLTTDHQMHIVGVEYKDLYEDAILAYAALVDQRKDILHYLYKTQMSIDKLKQKKYPSFLLDYESVKDANNDELNSDFRVTFDALIQLAVKAGINLSEYPELFRLKELHEKESQIDFQQANREQRKLMQLLEAAGQNDVVKSFLNSSERLRNVQISQFMMIRKLISAAESAGIRVESFSQLQAYADYLKTFTDLELETVLKSLEVIEDRAYTKLLPDDSAQKIRAIDRFISLLGNAYKLQMSSDQFKMLKFNEEDFKTESWLAFLNQQLAALGFFEQVIPYKNYLDNARESLGEFYTLVDKRDDAFIANAKRVMKEKDQQAAVLIAGGYHTANLTKLLKEEGMSYLVLTPVVNEKTNHEKYEKILLARIDKTLDRSRTGSPFSAQNAATTKIPRGIRAHATDKGEFEIKLAAASRLTRDNTPEALTRSISRVLAESAEENPEFYSPQTTGTVAAAPTVSAGRLSDENRIDLDPYDQYDPFENQPDPGSWFLSGPESELSEVKINQEASAAVTEEKDASDEDLLAIEAEEDVLEQIALTALQRHVAESEGAESAGGIEIRKVGQGSFAKVYRIYRDGDAVNQVIKLTTRTGLSRSTFNDRRSLGEFLEDNNSLTPYFAQTRDISYTLQDQEGELLEVVRQTNARFDLQINSISLQESGAGTDDLLNAIALSENDDAEILLESLLKKTDPDYDSDQDAFESLKRTFSEDQELLSVFEEELSERGISDNWKQGFMNLIMDRFFEANEALLKGGIFVMDQKISNNLTVNRNGKLAVVLHDFDQAISFDPDSSRYRFLPEERVNTDDYLVYFVSQSLNYIKASKSESGTYGFVMNALTEAAKKHLTANVLLEIEEDAEVSGLFEEAFKAGRNRADRNAFLTAIDRLRRSDKARQILQRLASAIGGKGELNAVSDLPYVTLSPTTAAKADGLAAQIRKDLLNGTFDLSKYNLKVESADLKKIFPTGARMAESASQLSEEMEGPNINFTPFSNESRRVAEQLAVEVLRKIPSDLQSDDLFDQLKAGEARRAFGDDAALIRADSNIEAVTIGAGSYNLVVAPSVDGFAFPYVIKIALALSGTRSDFKDDRTLGEFIDDLPNEAKAYTAHYGSLNKSLIYLDPVITGLRNQFIESLKQDSDRTIKSFGAQQLGLDTSVFLTALLSEGVESQQDLISLIAEQLAVTEEYLSELLSEDEEFLRLIQLDDSSDWKQQWTDYVIGMFFEAQQAYIDSGILLRDLKLENSILAIQKGRLKVVINDHDQAMQYDRSSGQYLFDESSNVTDAENLIVVLMFLLRSFGKEASDKTWDLNPYFANAISKASSDTPIAALVERIRNTPNFSSLIVGSSLLIQMGTTTSLLEQISKNSEYQSIFDAFKEILLSDEVEAEAAQGSRLSSDTWEPENPEPPAVNLAVEAAELSKKIVQNAIEAKYLSSLVGTSDQIKTEEIDSEYLSDGSYNIVSRVSVGNRRIALKIAYRLSSRYLQSPQPLTTQEVLSDLDVFAQQYIARNVTIPKSVASEGNSIAIDKFKLAATELATAESVVFGEVNAQEFGVDPSELLNQIDDDAFDSPEEILAEIGNKLGLSENALANIKNAADPALFGRNWKQAWADFIFSGFFEAQQVLSESGIFIEDSKLANSLIVIRNNQLRIVLSDFDLAYEFDVQNGKFTDYKPRSVYESVDAPEMIFESLYFLLFGSGYYADPVLYQANHPKVLAQEVQAGELNIEDSIYGIDENRLRALEKASQRFDVADIVFRILSDKEKALRFALAIQKLYGVINLGADNTSFLAAVESFRNSSPEADQILKDYRKIMIESAAPLQSTGARLGAATAELSDEVIDVEVETLIPTQRVSQVMRRSIEAQFGVRDESLKFPSDTVRRLIRLMNIQRQDLGISDAVTDEDGNVLHGGGGQAIVYSDSEQIKDAIYVKASSNPSNVVDVKNEHGFLSDLWAQGGEIRNYIPQPLGYNEQQIEGTQNFSEVSLFRMKGLHSAKSLADTSVYENLSPASRKRIFTEVAKAISTLHNLKIRGESYVHGDVAPRNIVIGYRNTEDVGDESKLTVQIIDFGGAGPVGSQSQFSDVDGFNLNSGVLRFQHDIHGIVASLAALHFRTIPAVLTLAFRNGAQDRFTRGQLESDPIGKLVNRVLNERYGESDSILNDAELLVREFEKLKEEDFQSTAEISVIEQQPGQGARLATGDLSPSDTLDASEIKELELQKLSDVNDISALQIDVEKFDQLSVKGKLLYLWNFLEGPQGNGVRDALRHLVVRWSDEDTPEFEIPESDPYWAGAENSTLLGSGTYSEVYSSSNDPDFSKGLAVKTPIVTAVKDTTIDVLNEAILTSLLAGIDDVSRLVRIGVDPSGQFYYVKYDGPKDPDMKIGRMTGLDSYRSTDSISNAIKALKVLKRTAQSVQQLHKAGKIHLDIKPRNILVDKSGHSVLSDFGTLEPIGKRSGPRKATQLYFDFFANKSTENKVDYDYYALAVTLLETAAENEKSFQSFYKGTYLIKEHDFNNKLPDDFEAALHPYFRDIGLGQLIFDLMQQYYENNASTEAKGPQNLRKLPSYLDKPEAVLTELDKAIAELVAKEIQAGQAARNQARELARKYQPADGKAPSVLGGLLDKVDQGAEALAGKNQDEIPQIRKIGSSTDEFDLGELRAERAAGPINSQSSAARLSSDFGDSDIITQAEKLLDSAARLASEIEDSVYQLSNGDVELIINPSSADQSRTDASVELESGAVVVLPDGEAEFSAFENASFELDLDGVKPNLDSLNRMAQIAQHADALVQNALFAPVNDEIAQVIEKSALQLELEAAMEQVFIDSDSPVIAERVNQGWAVNLRDKVIRLIGQARRLFQSRKQSKEPKVKANPPPLNRSAANRALKFEQALKSVTSDAIFRNSAGIITDKSAIDLESAGAGGFNRVFSVYENAKYQYEVAKLTIRKGFDRASFGDNRSVGEFILDHLDLAPYLASTEDLSGLLYDEDGQLLPSVRSVNSEYGAEINSLVLQEAGSPLDSLLNLVSSSESLTPDQFLIKFSILTLTPYSLNNVRTSVRDAFSNDPELLGIFSDENLSADSSNDWRQQIATLLISRFFEMNEALIRGGVFVIDQKPQNALAVNNEGKLSVVLHDFDQAVEFDRNTLRAAFDSDTDVGIDTNLIYYFGQITYYFNAHKNNVRQHRVLREAFESAARKFPSANILYSILDDANTATLFEKAYAYERLPNRRGDARVIRDRIKSTPGTARLLKRLSDNLRNPVELDDIPEVPPVIEAAGARLTEGAYSLLLNPLPSNQVSSTNIPQSFADAVSNIQDIPENSVIPLALNDDNYALHTKQRRKAVPVSDVFRSPVSVLDIPSSAGFQIGARLAKEFSTPSDKGFFRRGDSIQKLKDQGFEPGNIMLAVEGLFPAGLTREESLEHARQMLIAYKTGIKLLQELSESYEDNFYIGFEDPRSSDNELYAQVLQIAVEEGHAVKPSDPEKPTTLLLPNNTGEKQGFDSIQQLAGLALYKGSEGSLTDAQISDPAPTVATALAVNLLSIYGEEFAKKGPGRDFIRSVARLSGARSIGSFVDYVIKAAGQKSKSASFIEESEDFIFAVAMVLEELTKRSFSLAQTAWSA